MQYIRKISLLCFLMAGFLIATLNMEARSQTNSSTALSTPGPYVTELDTSQRSTSKTSALGPDQQSNDLRKPSGVPDADKRSATIVFDGLKALSKSDVFKALLEERIELPKNQLDLKAIEHVADKLKELLSARGYMHATVNVLPGEDPGLVRFHVNEGPRVSIADIRFEGTKAFAPSELAAKTKACLAGYQRSEGYDREILEVCLRLLVNSVRSQGYLQAIVGEPWNELRDNALFINVSLKEGPLFRLGQVEIEGAKYFVPAQLRALFPLQRGEVANGGEIGQWLFENLKKLYAESGYISYTAGVDPEFHIINRNGEGVVDLKVTIDEGNQFKLHSIKLKGENIEEPRLLSLLSLRQGDIYNHRIFEEFIDKLNGTGLFELIDKDKDSDFATNDEEGWLSITVRLKRRSE